MEVKNKGSFLSGRIDERLPGLRFRVSIIGPRNLKGVIQGGKK